MHVKVKVFPDSREELVKRGDKDAFEMYIREPAKEGRANKRVREILEEHFPGQRIRLVSGHQSRNKVFVITQ